MIDSRSYCELLQTKGVSILRNLLAGLGIMLILLACTTTPPSPVVDTETRVSARTAYARGNWEQAALQWQQDALAAGPQQAAAMRVYAADAWMLARQPDRAEEILRWVKQSELKPGDRARMNLVLADLALRYNRPDEAETLLRSARPDLPDEMLKRYEDLSARAQQLSSTPGTMYISKAEAISQSMVDYQPRSALAILESLENVSSTELAARAHSPGTDPSLAGWLDLALGFRVNLTRPDHLTEDIEDWKARHPAHMLDQGQALELWLLYRQRFMPPRKVAVLLPGSGRLQAAGAAIRDGLIGAYLGNPGGSEIVFFDTDDDPQSAIAAYFQALDEGAQWIIGPLQKSSVEALLGLAGLATPVLALNDLPEDYLPPPGLSGQIHALSLPQEADARAAAAHAISQNYRRAIVLAPESSWGERMALAFELEFLSGQIESGGGLPETQGDLLRQNRQIIAAARYPESENDHSSVLERLLLIDESKARKSRLQNTLQMPLEFEAVRRDDVDVIFLAATPQQAMLLRPQLRFLDAGSIPVYATGRIYSGKPDRNRNQDLNGIRFPVSPWQLAHTSTAEIPKLESIRQGTLSSLFALGRDAWNMLPWLGLMKSDMEFRFRGDSGDWRIDNSGNLDRIPAWAEFERGKPVPFVPSPLLTAPLTGRDPGDSAILVR